MTIQVWLVLIAVFLAGFGWGQWYSEHKIRAERESIERGRLTVSMPLNPDDAAATMGLLKELVEKVKSETAAQ